jgi:hypothetical protein
MSRLARRVLVRFDFMKEKLTNNKFNDEFEG